MAPALVQLPIVLLFGVMYFLLIRPQQQRVKAQRAVISSLDVGDEVVTVGGVLGRVVNLTDDAADIETTPGTVLRCRRTAIAGRTSPLREPDIANGEEDGAQT